MSAIKAYEALGEIPTDFTEWEESFFEAAAEAAEYISE